MISSRPSIAFPLAAALALALALAVLALSGCAQAEKPVRPKITVSAATSLKAVLEEVAPDFEREHGVEIVLNFGASGQLARQVEAGAPVDVLVSADPDDIRGLAAGGLVDGERAVAFAGNELVVVVPAGNPARVAGPDDLARLDRLATGDPDVAPHGARAREWLEAVGLWASVEGKFVFAGNAAQTVDYVARREVDAGVGFATEARSRRDVEIVYTVPTAEVGEIAYVAAPVADGARLDLARAFVDFLTRGSTQRALEAHGFKRGPDVR